MFYTRMIRSLLLAMGLLFATCFSQVMAQQANPQQRFDEANNLYRQSKFTESANAYQQLIDEGYAERSLYFNAGNAWYKAGKIGASVYAYEKALQLSPEDAVIKHNLAIANQKVNGFVGELPLVFFQQWWLKLQHIHSSNAWAGFSLAFFWLLIAGMIVNLFIPGLKNKYLTWGNYLFGILFILHLLMAVDTYNIANNHDNGIVMTSTVKVKAAPDDNSKDLFELHEGMKVKVLDATKEFCKIEMNDGKNGWVICNGVKRL
ncbi:SH3 domain-containing protein [Chitinophaga sp. Cy-1792]|uniref:SH3 domain-containing protein n=1 Tax=Chitinophaga sp. Cy-1792 TaxID=2608339 RepID=UPI001423BA9A|nr:tetratricopeptide repeat protein [Chitinophaga sp. Cy-1792]NIG52481.1 tetratricopeptide repeat protein [Chitinophaga sp. Cy-1792]